MIQSKFNRLVMPLLFMSVLALFLTGCFLIKKEAIEQEKPPPPFKMFISTLDLYTKIGSRYANGGKFMLVTLGIKNLSNDDISIHVDNFFLRKRLIGAEKEYKKAFEQPTEKNMKTVIHFAISKEIGEKLLDRQDFGNVGEVTIHPFFEVEHVIVFLVPDTTLLEDYDLVYKPNYYDNWQEVVNSLGNPAIYVNDHSEEEIVEEDDDDDW